MKKKKLLIIVSIFTVCLVGIVILGVKVKGNNQVTEIADVEQYYQVEEGSSSKFKGISAISKEQKVIVDKTQGKPGKLAVEDKQVVQAGDVLFTYYNAEIEAEVAQLNKQINTMNSKIKKQKDEIAKLPKEQQEAALQQAGIGEGTPDVSMDIAKRDALKQKININVTAEIDGVVYIDESAKDDPTKPYIRIVSQEPLVVSQASQFDMESLKVDAPVEIKVISNGEKIKGKIINVEDLPSATPESKSVTYNFDIKPEKPIRVGFSVEVSVNPQKLAIPKDYVIVENEKTFVNIIDEENGSKKVEIKATLDGDNYILEDESVRPGDKLSKDSAEVVPPVVEGEN